MSDYKYQRINYFREWLNKLKDEEKGTKKETFDKTVAEFEKTNDISHKNTRRIIRKVWE
jgi:hypothetical protein